VTDCPLGVVGATIEENRLQTRSPSILCRERFALHKSASVELTCCSNTIGSAMLRSTAVLPLIGFQNSLAAQQVYPPHRFRHILRLLLKRYALLKVELPIRDHHPVQLANPIRKTHTTDQILLSALRRLGNGSSFEQMDDQCQMSSESQRQYFYILIEAFIARFGPKYLKWEPTLEELQNVVEVYKLLGFQGCNLSVDCMHLFGKNCPRYFKGKYKNLFTGKLAAICCEALCNRNIYCWSWFAGRCGTINDITVLDNSPFFIDILNNNRQMLRPDG
jgi:Plant transposon protein